MPTLPTISSVPWAAARATMQTEVGQQLQGGTMTLPMPITAPCWAERIIRPAVFRRQWAVDRTMSLVEDPPPFQAGTEIPLLGIIVPSEAGRKMSWHWITVRLQAALGTRHGQSIRLWAEDRPTQRSR